MREKSADAPKSLEGKLTEVNPGRAGAVHAVPGFARLVSMPDYLFRLPTAKLPMNPMNTTDRYHPLSIGMHWLMLALLVAVYACIELHELAPRGSSLRAGLKTWHFMLGLGVFALVFLRLAIRLTTPAPRRDASLPAWQHHLAGIMHLLLYAFLIVMPALGWLTLSAGGKVIPFFGLELPPLIAPDELLGERLEDLHGTIGTVGYYLVGLHAAAALYHHYFMHDDTLRRMLPRRGNGN
jgi:cytochrome b561